MEALGYPATWPTSCFINGGCGAAVFGHTNGYGDFVLFDELGPPWPVHACYLDRFFLGDVRGGGLFEVRADRLQEYRESGDTQSPIRRKISPREIKRIEPGAFISTGEFHVVGYVQDYFERRADKIAKSLGSFGQQALDKLLAGRRSQITIVTPDLNSYTIFANLKDIVIGRKDTIIARVRAVRSVAIPGCDSLFLGNELAVIRGSATE